MTGVALWRRSGSGAAQEQHGQEGGGEEVEGEAEAGTPDGPGVVDEAVVEDVEDSVGGECGDDEPETPAESDDGQGEEGGGDQGFDDERRRGTPHNGEQDVIGGDHHHHHRIEDAVAVESDEGGEDADAEG